MKKFLKNTISAVLISATLGAGHVHAGAVEAPAETVSVLGMYVQKIAKVGLYIETIAESVTYVGSVGKKGFNAAVGALASVAGNLSGFQNMLHFADASSFNSLLNQANSAVNNVTEQVDAVKNGVDAVKDTANTVKNDVVSAGKNVVDTAKDTVTNAGKNIVDKVASNGSQQEAMDELKSRITEAVSGGKTQEEAGSSYEKVGTAQTSYGAPQDNKTAANAYVKKMFFYSTKEGDMYEGKPLSETTQADEAVKKNRNKYRAEVISTAYATALENRKSGFEASLKRYEAIKQKAASAASEDDKRAVGALITQEETRQRIARLALDLAVLEQDVVNDLLAQPTNILIARTVEQINEETEKQNKDVNFKGAAENVLDDKLLEKYGNNGGQS